MWLRIHNAALVFLDSRATVRRLSANFGEMKIVLFQYSNICLFTICCLHIVVINHLGVSNLWVTLGEMNKMYYVTGMEDRLTEHE